jgi:hypothetical protein
MNDCSKKITQINSSLNIDNISFKSQITDLENLLKVIEAKNLRKLKITINSLIDFFEPKTMFLQKTKIFLPDKENQLENQPEHTFTINFN